MKLLRKLALMSLIVASITPSISVYAETPKIEDTFIFKNIKGALEGDGKKTYTITSTNTIKAKGTGVYGTSDKLINTKEWLDILASRDGELMSDVVKLVHSSSRPNSDNLLILNQDGEVFLLNESNKYPVKYDLNVKIQDIAIYSDGNAIFVPVFLTESGEVYFGDTKLEGLENIKYLSSYTSTYYFAGTNPSDGVVAVTKNGDGYIIDNKGFTKLPIQNIVELYPTSKINTLIVRFTSGDFMMYDTSKDELKKIVVKNSSGEEEKILNIVSDNANSVFYATTVEDTYSINATTLTATKMTTPVKPVAIAHSVAIGEDGNYYALSVADKSFTLVEDIDDMRVWKNDNPIVSDTSLANFDILDKSILGRVDNLDVTFSLVTQGEPQAFNLYYTKSTKTDKSNWVSIATNVPVSSMNTTVYDTGYVDAKGDKVLGKTYRYNWVIGNENLTDVRLIAEPIY